MTTPFLARYLRVSESWSPERRLGAAPFYRLDELPQLVNVLKGDMNVVGPRPEQPEIFAKLRHTVDNYHFRQRVLPGTTGLAQISHHYDMSVEDVMRKLHFDLDYVVNRSPARDSQVLARTLPVMVFCKGGW